MSQGDAAGPGDALVWPFATGGFVSVNGGILTILPPRCSVAAWIADDGTTRIITVVPSTPTPVLVEGVFF